MTFILPIQQKRHHEQRRIFLESSSRYLPGQSQALSQDWHPVNQIGSGMKIGSDAGLPGAGIGGRDDFGSGDFFCGLGEIGKVLTKNFSYFQE
jgi:hypothetical protein